MGGTNERGLLIRGFGVSEILVSLATIRTTEVFDHFVTFATIGGRSSGTGELGSIGGICIASPPEVSLGRLDDYPQPKCNSLKVRTRRRDRGHSGRHFYGVNRDHSRMIVPLKDFTLLISR
jgi:hypothetical protein